MEISKIFWLLKFWSFEETEQSKCNNIIYIYIYIYVYIYTHTHTIPIRSIWPPSKISISQPKSVSIKEGLLSIGYQSSGSQTWPIKCKAVFFQAAVVSILLYGYTTWTLTERMENKLDGNYTRMMRAILNKSWRQHPTKQLLW